MGAPGEFFETLQVLAIERLGRAKIHRNAVLNNLVLLQNPVEHRKRPATIDHIVFRDDLEPVDDRFLGEDVIVVWNSQSDTDTIIGKRVESISGHH